MKNSKDKKKKQEEKIRALLEARYKRVLSDAYRAKLQGAFERAVLGGRQPSFLSGKMFEDLSHPANSRIDYMRTAGQIDSFVSINGIPVAVECKVQGGDVEEILDRYERGIKPQTKYVAYFSRYTSKRKYPHAPVMIPTEEFAAFILERHAFKYSNGHNYGDRVLQPIVSAFDELVSMYPVFTPFAKTQERADTLTRKDLTEQEKEWLDFLFACYEVTE